MTRREQHTTDTRNSIAPYKGCRATDGDHNIERAGISCFLKSNGHYIRPVHAVKNPTALIEQKVFILLEKTVSVVHQYTYYVSKFRITLHVRREIRSLFSENVTTLLVFSPVYRGRKHSVVGVPTRKVGTQPNTVEAPTENVLKKTIEVGSFEKRIALAIFRPWLT